MLDERFALPLVLVVACGVACSAILGIDERKPYPGGHGGSSGSGAAGATGSASSRSGAGGASATGGMVGAGAGMAGTGGSCSCAPGACDTCPPGACAPVPKSDGWQTLDGDCGQVDCHGGHVVGCALAPCTKPCSTSGGYCDGRGDCIFPNGSSASSSTIAQTGPTTGSGGCQGTVSASGAGGNIPGCPD